MPCGEALETMHPAVSPSPGFELALLRKSVGAAAEAHDRCVHCHRTPLVGERVYLYDERIVCELCRPRRREAPHASALVRSPEHSRAVRVRRL
jgi:recombinational DNA repair protein (RecF pathway)